MLSSVLNSPQAIRVNIEIMRAFVRLRAMISTNKELSRKLDELERKVATHDKTIAGLITDPRARHPGGARAETQDRLYPRRLLTAGSPPSALASGGSIIRAWPL
jgi:hypothetical protein